MFNDLASNPSIQLTIGILAILIAFGIALYERNRSKRLQNQVDNLEKQVDNLSKASNDPYYWQKLGMETYSKGLYEKDGLYKEDKVSNSFTIAYNYFERFLSNIQYDASGFEEIINEIFWIESYRIFPDYEPNVREIEVLITLILLKKGNDKRYTRILKELIVLYEQRTAQKLPHYLLPIYLNDKNFDGIQSLVQDFQSFNDSKLQSKFKELILAYCSL